MTNAVMPQQYIENQMLSSSPGELVLMLFDGSVRFLRASINELEKNNIAEKARLIEKTFRIIDYLKSCLDMEKGGEIALNLDRLYDYILMQLTTANMKNDRKKIEEVLSLILPIRDAWGQICDRDRTAHNLDQASGVPHQSHVDALHAQQKGLVIPPDRQFSRPAERVAVKI